MFEHEALFEHPNVSLYLLTLGHLITRSVTQIVLGRREGVKM